MRIKPETFYIEQCKGQINVSWVLMVLRISLVKTKKNREELKENKTLLINLDHEHVALVSNRVCEQRMYQMRWVKTVTNDNIWKLRREHFKRSNAKRLQLTRTNTDLGPLVLSCTRECKSVYISAHAY